MFSRQLSNSCEMFNECAADFYAFLASVSARVSTVERGVAPTARIFVSFENCSLLLGSSGIRRVYFCFISYLHLQWIFRELVDLFLLTQRGNSVSRNDSPLEFLFGSTIERAREVRMQMGLFSIHWVLFAFKEHVRLKV